MPLKVCALLKPPVDSGAIALHWFVDLRIRLEQEESPWRHLSDQQLLMELSKKVVWSTDSIAINKLQNTAYAGSLLEENK